MKPILLSLAAAALAVAPAAAAPQKATLAGNVGPAFTISLKKNGVTVKTLPPGTYVLVVRDQATIHNFHLRGPGVNKDSGVGFVGTRTWAVTLKRGTYKYQCDPHSSSMNGSFRVT